MEKYETFCWFSTGLFSTLELDWEEDDIVDDDDDDDDNMDEDEHSEELDGDMIVKLGLIFASAKTLDRLFLNQFFKYEKKNNQKYYINYSFKFKFKIIWTKQKKHI